MTRLIRRFFEMMDAITPTANHRFGRFEAGVLITAALGMVTMQFGGMERVFFDLFGGLLSDPSSPQAAYMSPVGLARSNPWYDLLSLVHWVGFCVLGYAIIPMAYLKLSKRKLGDYYISPRGFFNHLGVYLALAAPVLVVVWVVSFLEDFQSIYPFYKGSSRSWFDLIAWELAYGLQFLALEFFFRGFLLEGLRRAMGHGAIFVMLVPYCMVHFGKTAAESVGSLAAGVVLGVLAMSFRSIWGGALLHWIIAIAMDVASMVQTDRLPKRFWPE